MLMHLNEREDSLETIEKAIELEPNSGYHWNIKAWILKYSERFEEAIIPINKAIELEPNWWGHYHEKSDIFSFQDKYEESLEAINKAIQLNPTNDELYSIKATCLDSLKRHEEALSTINKAIQLNSKDLGYYEQKIDILNILDQYDQASNVLDDLFQLFPEDSYIYIIKGSLLFVREQYTELAELYESAIKKFPKEASLYSGKAEALELVGENERAIEFYSKAFELKSDSFYLRMIAEILFKLEKYEDTFSFIDKHISELEADEKKVDLYDCKSRFFAKLKRYDEALVSIDKGLKLDPDYRFMHLSKAYILYKEEKYDQAIDICQNLINSDLLLSKAYYTQGKSYYKMGEFLKAIEKFKKAKDSVSYKEPKFYYYLTMCYKAMGDNESTNRNYEQLKASVIEKKDKKWLEKLNEGFPVNR